MTFHKSSLPLVSAPRLNTISGSRPGGGPSSAHTCQSRKHVFRAKRGGGYRAPSLEGGYLLQYNRGPGGRLLDPSCELEVLKCIMLREGYLSRVTCLAEDLTRKTKRGRGQPLALPAGLTDLLDLLRVATVDTVEAISIWRLSQTDPTPRPFIWNGQNYLMKMLHDCDFLDRVETVRGWFGFSMHRNPCLFPSTAWHNSGQLRDAATSDTFEPLNFDKLGLADVGQQPWLGPLKIVSGDPEDCIDGDLKTQRKKKDTRKGNSSSGPAGLAPYAAAVIHDPTLLPRSRTSVRGGSAPVQSTVDAMESEFNPTTFVDTEGVVPNLVSRGDVARVIAANKALAEEEARVLGTPAARRDGQGDSVEDCGIVAGTGSLLELRPSSAHEGRPSRRKRSYIQQRGEESGGDRKRSPITAWSGHPNPTDDNNNRSSLEGGEDASPTLTAAGLLQVPVPSPHSGLGPVLLRSECPGSEECPKPFLHTVTKAVKTLECTSMDWRGPKHPMKSELGTSYGEQSPHSKSPPDPVEHSESHRASSAAPHARVSKSHDDTGIHADDLSGPLETNQPAEAQCTKSDGRAYASRALQKAGAELRALTAASTTGRRNPPPREVRLRRLARDVHRHAAELRDLRYAEEQIRGDLTSLGNMCTVAHAKSPEECVDWTVEGGNSCSDVADGMLEKAVDSSPSGGQAMLDTEAITEGEDAAPENERSAMFAKGCERTSVEHSTGDISMGAKSDDSRQGDRTVCQRQTRVTEEATLTAAHRGRALLNDKLREIDLKSFDLEIKRGELACLRAVQRQERERKQALALERRRAQLEQGQTLPEDDAVAETLEEGSAVTIQRRCRGIWARQYAAWYRNNVHQAATTIQRGVRCAWDRRATARRLLMHASAKPIQATVRMLVKRKRYLHLRQERRELVACRKLQKVCRGMRGRRRAAARRKMMAAAKRAVDWVSLDNLQPKHLKELASAIHGALIDPLRSLPSAGVLGALRVALTILDTTDVEQGGSGEGDTVTFQTALGRTVRGAIFGPDLTWEMAARVLDRPFRLLRRMRAFASGLGAAFDPAPIRLLRINSRAVRLLHAYRGDPAWSAEALKAMPAGRKATLAVVEWARELGRVYDEQPHVEDFLRDAQPAWLRNSRSLQKRRRALELHAESCRSAVTTATEHRETLKHSGHAYGGPVLALTVLEEGLETAETELAALEMKRRAFLQAQAAAEAAEGRALTGDAEFAEREASVAARAEEMARRTGVGGAEAVADCERKTRDCEVVFRERKRLLRVWERRCREHSKPLLDEWVPPTNEQLFMARSLGTARAWVEILRFQKGRIVDEAGGPRFVKGLPNRKLESWIRTSEGLNAYRADVEACELRAAERVQAFEMELAMAHAEAASKKVCSMPWDNATEATQQEEQNEDWEAALNERQTAIGATLPPGFLANNNTSADGRGVRPNRLPQRPTLVLLGLDLPVAVRNGIKARLDTDLPGLFGVHVGGIDALPSVAAAARRRGRAFLAPSLEAASTLPFSRPEEPSTGTRTPFGSPIPLLERTVGWDGERNVVDAVCPTRSVSCGGYELSEDNRVHRLQGALYAGRNASIEVSPGPGLWTRGRFLRDLEALLGGLDECGGDNGSAAGKPADGPTVVLVRGHDINRSGGGEDVGHGTDAAETTAMPSTPGNKARGDAASAAAAESQRAKRSLEAAAQCLHDLRVTHGRLPNPILVQSSEKGVDSQRVTGTQRTTPDKRNTHSSDSEARRPYPASGHTTQVLEVLLAACQMLLHPSRRYPMANAGRWKNVTPNASALTEAPPKGDFGVQSNITDLSAACRKQVAEPQPARALAELLGSIDLTSVPFETALALRGVMQHEHWPSTSPRPAFAGNGALETFSGWVVAAVDAVIALSLGEGSFLRGETASGSSARRPGSSCTEEENHCWGSDARTLAKDSGGSFDDELSPLAGIETARIAESEALDVLQGLLIHKDISVVDDDLPQLSDSSEQKRSAVGVSSCYCRTSEAFGKITEIAVRPFEVHREEKRSIPFADHNALVAAGGMRFNITVSRASGSVYVRAMCASAELPCRERVVTARLADENLVPLLSPNWMEKHDLSGLRELGSGPAVWKALVDSLVLQLPIDARPPSTSTGRASNISERKDLSTEHVLLRERSGSVIVDHSPGGNDKKGTYVPCSLGILSFRHSRRKALETTCLLMGRAVPVTLYEESRTDFWCEARVPCVSRTGLDFYTTVGLSVPKECIPLLLSDDHPMHLRTTLDTCDVRELCVLIADRLKICRTSSDLSNRRSYKYWLDNAILGHDRTSGVRDVAEKAPLGSTAGSTAYRLTLRKRGVGQVVFSRLITFRMSSRRQGDEEHRDCIRRESDDVEPERNHATVQALVTLKEISHRGAIGELYAEIGDPSSTTRIKQVPLSPELTRVLLGTIQHSMAESDKVNAFGAASDRGSASLQITADYTKRLLIEHWRNAVTWRLRITRVNPARRNASMTAAAASQRRTRKVATKFFSRLMSVRDGQCLVMDERKPVFKLFSIPVRTERSRVDEKTPSYGRLRVTGSDMFDLVLLPTERIHLEGAESFSCFEMVFIHRLTMAAFRFKVPVFTIFEATCGLAEASLATPTTLSTELQLPASSLCDLVGRWLLYTGSDNAYSVGHLTLAIPGTDSVQTSPYNGLRWAGKRLPVSRASVHAGGGNVMGQTADALHDSLVHKDSVMELQNEDSPEPYNVQRNEAHALVVPPAPARQQRAGSINMPVDVRNERMVFRRKLPIPVMHMKSKKPPEPSSATSSGHTGEELREELTVSVYEVFASGDDGRVVRSLKLCAEDDTVSPAFEVTARLAWAGTCAGNEGGPIWNLVTKGLSCRKMRDDRGSAAALTLAVSVPEGACSDVVDTSRLPDESEGIHFGSSSSRQQGTSASRENRVSPSAQKSRGCSDKASGAYKALQLLSQREGPKYVTKPVKIYDGWHTITGMWLHVQCFQEGGSGASDFGNIHDSDSPTNRRSDLAGRGGVIGVPPGAVLRFAVCDPCDGRRSETSILADDLRRNSSWCGGIVDAELLVDGRRPLLAKVIANKLQLVFEADGGYTVVLPLPKGWIRQ